MKVKRKKPKIGQVMSTCSWCGKKVGNDVPIYAVGCKKRPNINIVRYEGKAMPVKISTIDKTIWSIVPPPDSDARRDGNDLMFTLCSENCGEKLKETLEKEKEIGDLILSIKPIY